MKMSAGLDFQASAVEERDLWQALLAEGRPLLLLSGLVLVLVGGFAIFLGLSGHFLPHDEQFLGMSVAQLCRYHDCRIVHFMIHDRIAFGGSLIAVGVLYLWLVEFPLRKGESWAWWALAVSGAVGFCSFLAWLRYGYLDTWHGVATLLLLPCFVLGLLRSYQTLQPATLLQVIQSHRAKVFDFTQITLVVTVVGLISAGAVILIGGSTRVFVPQDLHYMHLAVDDLSAISPRLVPLIAHDRAGFGGAILAAGIAMGFCVWFAPLSKSLWQCLLLAGSAGFGCAIVVHFGVGYVNWVHLAPALLGALVFYVGLLGDRVAYLLIPRSVNK